MEKNCSILFNPTSTGFKEKKLDEVCSILSKKYEVEKLRSEYPGHVISLTEKANGTSDLIISYGGDGTFGEVIKGIFDVEQKALISHIPIGTANDLKRNFRLANNPYQSAKLIMDGVEQSLDIFTINGVPMAYVGAFGYLANVPCNTNHFLKHHFGYIAYLVNGVKEYQTTSPIIYNLSCVTDKTSFKDNAIVVAITNSIGFGGMSLFDGVDLSDGLFEVTFVRNMTKLDMLKVAKDVVTGKFNLNNYSLVTNHFKTSYLSLDINNGLNVPIDIDGDLCNETIGCKSLEIKRGKVVKTLLPPR